MPEYIEREALMQDISETVVFSVRSDAKLPTSEMRGANKVIDRIKSAPTADVVEVRHGEWIAVSSSDMSTGKAFKCSKCQKMRYGVRLPPYCQECGAKMDGKGD